MYDDITNRQRDLLLSIIKEFIETAEAVGSISLQSKYNLKMSTATIRNEMADLVLLGYLFQKHLSSGRIPTTKGWRFFIEYLKSLDLNNLDTVTKENIKAVLYKMKPDFDTLVRQSLNFLSGISENAAIALIDKELYYSGLSELVKIPEFRDSDNLRRILTILEDYNTLSEMLNKENSDDEINILIGEETGKEIFTDYALVFTELRVNGINKGYIAVIGPNRMRYDKVIPILKYIADTMRRILSN